MFKGGTSLSKVYRAIERFSEDVDLTVDRRAVSGEISKELDAGPSAARRGRLLKSLQRASADFIERTVVPVLRDAMGKVPAAAGLALECSGDDPQTWLLRYRATADEVLPEAYIRPSVRLEFGARGETWPSERHEVRPFVAEAFPEEFTAASARVTVLELARTLWEKATILHQVAYAGVRSMGERMSRHYYDLARIAATTQGREAISRIDLLEAVAAHKADFFRDGRAAYHLARPGTLRLIPDEAALRLLAQDYRRMSEMFFHEPEPFSSIIESLRALEADINQ